MALDFIISCHIITIIIISCCSVNHLLFLLLAAAWSTIPLILYMAWILSTRLLGVGVCTLRILSHISKSSDIEQTDQVSKNNSVLCTCVNNQRFGITPVSPTHRTLIVSMCPTTAGNLLQNPYPVHKAQERKQDLVKYCCAFVEEHCSSLSTKKWNDAKRSWKIQNKWAIKWRCCL